MPITIRLERFEGPLDLLLYLIQSHELDISKISIGKITEQYVAYVRLMQELNFDIASDFLVMAATLIQWKSKALLPQEEGAAGAQATEDDVMTPEELMRQLLEHQRFLAAGQELALRPLLGDDVFRRQLTRPPTEKVWKNMEVTQLMLTYQDLLVRERKRTQLLKKETVSLSTKIMDFADRLAVGKITGMRALLRDLKSRPETVVTFLASLELARLRKMKVYQEGVYEEIYVELLESLKGFDTRLASGFDHLTEQVDKQIETGTSVASADFGHNGSLYDAAAGDAVVVGAEAELGSAGAGDAAVSGAEADRTGVADLGGAEADRTGVADLGGAEADRTGVAAGTDAEAGNSASDAGADAGDAGAAVVAQSGSPDLRGVDDGVARGPAAEFDLAGFGEDDAGSERVSGPDDGAGDAPAVVGNDPTDRRRGGARPDRDNVEP